MGSSESHRRFGRTCISACTFPNGAFLVNMISSVTTHQVFRLLGFTTFPRVNLLIS